MYRILSESENGEVGIKIQRKLSSDDYGLLIPYLDQLRHEVSPIRLVCDMTECAGLDSQAVWEDLTRQLQQFPEIIRVAVVGDSQWMDCGTKVFHPLLEPTVQYFTPEHMERAWKWLKEDGT